MDKWPLPEGWEWCKIEQVCEVNPRKPSLERDEEAPTSFVPMAAVDEVQGAITDMEVEPYHEVQRGYTYFEEGDVLFAKITPSMENGKAAIARGLIDDIGFGSTEFHRLRPHEEIIPEWVYFFVRQKSFRREAATYFRGSVGQQRVPKEFLAQHSIPVPPLDVQRRLVARIETLLTEVDAARRLHVKIEEEGEELMDAALAEIFDGSHFKKHAEWVTVEDLGEVMGGLTKNRRRRSYPLRLPYLRVANVYANELKLDDVQEIGVREAELDRVLLQRGDLLIVEGNGSISQIGRVALWDGSIDPCVHQNHIIKVRFGTSLLSKYVLYWLLSPQGRNEIVKVASATSGLYTLSLSKVSNLPLPLVSADEQRKIVAYLDQVPGQIDDLTRVSAALAADLERTEQAILARAFRGEL